MSDFKIVGNKELKGTIYVGGAKNAALKILPAAILGAGISKISNVPNIIDIEKMIEILRSIGADISVSGHTVTIDSDAVTSHHPDEKKVKKLRGSIVLVGALLSRFGKAVFSQPGGCLIGARTIDDHLDVFAQLGVEVEYRDENYYLSGFPKPGRLVLKKMSVTATENAILATVLCKGTTEIHAAAAEPEIADLANYLNKMGAKITGAGTHDITVVGVEKLQGKEYEILPDRIEAGTYLMAALAGNWEVTIGPVIAEHLDIVIKRLTDAGAKIEVLKKDGVEFLRTHKYEELIGQDIDTRPYPGFPTDLQSPCAVLMTQAKGASRIFETMFEGRFSYLEELKLLRASVDILNPHEIIIKGISRLKGTTIASTDIRGGAALVIAALIADGETYIEGIELVDRGYEKIDEKLNSIGASIERIN